MNKAKFLRGEKLFQTSESEENSAQPLVCFLNSLISNSTYEFL